MFKETRPPNQQVPTKNLFKKVLKNQPVPINASNVKKKIIIIERKRKTKCM